MKTFAEFDRALDEAIEEIGILYGRDPLDGAVDSIRAQLDALRGWTRGGREPSQDQKDRLNFGLIASRELSDEPVAEKLYGLASFVIWWGERPAPPGTS